MAEADKLTINNHHEVCQLLKNLCRNDLIQLGGALGLSFPKLKRTDNTEDIVADWLNRRDDVLQRSGEPTWESLVKALREIGHNGIAADILKSKCQRSDTGSQQQTTGGQDTATGSNPGMATRTSTDTQMDSGTTSSEEGGSNFGNAAGITDTQMDSGTTSTSSDKGQSCGEEPLYSLEADAPEKALPKPRTGTPQLKCLKDFASEVVIILHTTDSPSEKPAVLKDMTAPELESDPALDPPVARPINLLGVPNKIILGMFGGYKCALVQTEQGEKCKKEIEDALEHLPNTRCVIALGMAYSSTKYKFGDVLVSKTIRGVVNPKFKGDGIVIRSSEHDSVPVIDYLSNTFARDLHNWKDFQCSTTGRESKAYAGDVVSVSWLISAKSFRDSLHDNFSDAIGGEMEGHELVKIQREYNQKNHPQQLGVIIIKGAADYADENKQGGKKWQYTAARAATHFAKYQLECTNGTLFDS